MAHLKKGHLWDYQKYIIMLLLYDLKLLIVSSYYQEDCVQYVMKRKIQVLIASINIPGEFLHFEFLNFFSTCRLMWGRVFPKFIFYITIYLYLMIFLVILQDGVQLLSRFCCLLANPMGMLFFGWTANLQHSYCRQIILYRSPVFNLHYNSLFGFGQWNCKVNIL